jgi:uncharacterized protein DUF2567
MNETDEPAGPRLSNVRAGLNVIVGLALAGVVVGALWAWLAPPIRGVVALADDGERVRVYLGNESDHFFIAAYLLVGMLCTLAVVAAVLVWQWRAHRGPTMAASLALGLAAAAGAASGVGALLVHWQYGAIDVAGAPISPEHRVHYVTEAPPVFFAHGPLQIALTILMPAAVGAAVYALIAVATPRDDLGAWPPIEPVVPGPGQTFTAESALPSAP